MRFSSPYTSLSAHISDSQVARRDGYTCCFTGALDRSAPKGYVEKLNAGGEVRKKAHMNAAHIFKRVAVVWEDDDNEAKVRQLHPGAGLLC